MVTKLRMAQVIVSAMRSKDIVTPLDYPLVQEMAKQRKKDLEYPYEQALKILSGRKYQ
tara:strand:+ start:7377 stop:7550 length:174 start_codon:yes stop_codon:yes gene_type:complete